MKTKNRFILASAVILIMAFGIWNVAQAEKGSFGTGAGLSPMLLSRFFQVRTGVSELETRTPQATEDNQRQQADDNSQSTVSPEPGDDNQASHESASTPEPGDDNQVQHESSGIPGANSEVTGVITAIDGNTVTVNGMTFNLTNITEGAAMAKIGDTVKLELVTNADGSLSVREIKTAAQAGGADDSSADDHGGSSGSDNSGGHHGGGSGGDGGGGGDGGSDG